MLTQPLVLGVFAVGFATAGIGIHTNYPVGNTLTLRTAKDIVTNAEYGFLIAAWLLGFALFMGYYPASISSGGTTTNILSHVIGLTYGFIVSLVSLNILGPDPSISDTMGR